MLSAGPSPVNYQVAEFAWRIKNWVRPLGLKALNLPCQLMGTGMAFPWILIRSANLATGSIVEDLKLGLDLALCGRPPLFCPSAVVTSPFPLSVEGAKSQRKRWEGGHVSFILASLPGFIRQAVAGRNLNLFALTLDLAIPPLSLLVLLLVCVNFVDLFALFCGLPPLALIINGICIVILALAISLSWVRYGRDILTFRAMSSVLPYIFAKLPIYRRLFLHGAVSSWTSTDRKNAK
jgi:cellulose synthase/poly-beta-1,6-N-acetylglucosamine synthase-like glycosyltransferase